MKKNILTMMLFAVAAIASVSCQKEDQNAPAESVTLTFTSANPETKTEWNDNTIVWSAGDIIRVACQISENEWYSAGNPTEPKMYVSEALPEGGVTAKFKLKTGNNSFPVDMSGNLQFYALYPSTCNGNSASFKNAPKLSYDISAQQTSTLQSYDKSCDVLWAKAEDEYSAISSIPTSGVSMAWTRVVAHAHITLKGIYGIEAGEIINSITLTAQENAPFVGKYDLNITNGTVEENKTANSLTVNCSDIVADASGNVTFWACINPCTVTSLNIVVDTDKAVYSIDKTGLNCEFLVNKRNVLPVNMSAAVRTPKDLTGAALPFEETFESVTTTSTNSQLTSLDGFLELSRIYPNSGSVKFSASSESGKMVTKLLDLSSAFFVRILSKGWDSDEVTLTVEAGEESKDITMITHGDTGDFVEYVVNFDGIDNSESITITTPGGKRAFVDNIYIGEGAAVAAPVIVAQTPDKLAADAASVAIKYSVYNPVEGKTLTASTEADWLTEVQYADGTVTYNVAANTEDERNATVTLSYEGATPVEVVVTQAATLEAGTVVDVLTRANTTSTNSTYKEWSGQTLMSGATYAGLSAGGNSSIQLSKAVTAGLPGIVTTASGGNVRKIVVTWNDNTAAGRILTIYGKSTAYESIKDLEEESKRGIALGTIVKGTSTELVVEGDYQYIGMSANNALYLTEIQITWENSVPTPTLATSTDAIPQP